MSRRCDVGEVLSPLPENHAQADTDVAVNPAHITVCVCTYRRPELLKRLLVELETQETAGLFTYSVVVIDNDSLESGKAVSTEIARHSQLIVEYEVEPRQNIATARNRAIAKASGDFVAFIDDDEFPIQTWLLTLFRACLDYGVEGVLGPVKRHFDEVPPRWITKGDFYERPTYSTGLVIDWRKGRTGNVLLKRELFLGETQPFRPEFRQGEDQDFFQRMIEKGCRFIWCDEAVAYEVVPPIRWKRTFMLKRALLRGAMEPKTSDFGFRSIVKSLLAIPAYLFILPFAAVSGHHKFMAVLVRLFDHFGKLLATIGINPVKEQYVTE